ncbi:MAG: hypothetical protein J7647_20360 [Cyanobacteria bacterium SBLK]|nr:hypothetical protein [Cyanobacteria bacterium SBLK]
MSFQWVVQLNGNVEQIQLLQSSEFQVFLQGDRWYLKSDQFNDCEDVLAADPIARELLQESLNEIAIDAICKFYDSGEIKNCSYTISGHGYTSDHQCSSTPPNALIPLSSHHLDAASYFAKSSYDLERSGDQNNLNKNISYVIGSIVTSASYLEAKINEHFEMTYKDIFSSIESGKILDKYQIYLRLSQKQLFNKGTEPFQSACKVIDLRNNIVHYKINNTDKPSKAEKIIKGKSGIIKLSPLADRGSEFFPYQGLSYSCAKWAFISVASFTNKFFDKLELEPAKIDIESYELPPEISPAN